MPSLSNWQEEADSWIISHVHWAVGIEVLMYTVVVVSNDTDTLVLLLRYIVLFVENGLKQLWIVDTVWNRGEEKDDPTSSVVPQTWRHWKSMLLIGLDNYLFDISVIFSSRTYQFIF